ncbi:hypothetical protein HMN09_00852000 [Mycena chlorophos]|uniref:Uncharacterized protein n=1 Tax=Mycena chlorophos TaxID=658473 RepID=A0A8H6STL5_MYCCL|nr:hypothetical protein HMN09_00852000 [Mycena chlorophos]
MPPADTDASSLALVSPPSYTPLAKFRVGSKETKAFVTVDQLKDHLALLHALAELRLRVENTSAEDLGIEYFPPENEKSRRWSVFVGFAVERFERWCLALQPSDVKNGIAPIFPPVDVLMVWHTYLLNPGWHAEDCIRIPALKGLWTAGKALGASLGMGFGQLLDAIPSPSDTNVRSWIQLTGTPFDAFDAIRSMCAAEKQVECPKCGALNFTPYLSADGTGYLQVKFTRVCSNPTIDCFFNITHTALAMAKLARDLAAPDFGEPQDVLAGTLYTPGNTKNLQHGQDIKDRLIYTREITGKRPLGSLAPGADTVTALDIMRLSKWLFSALKGKMSNVLREEPRVLQRIMNAYTDGRIFSVELVSAVLRQAGFVRKMYELDWTKPGAFDNLEDEVALWHVIARYHAFLDLMANSPRIFLVPTLDIDLAWHTHQLRSYEYYYDTKNHVRVFVDHDDKVESTSLSNSFDGTSAAWKKRYGQQYTYCGCPLPGNSVGQRLSSFMGLGGHDHSKGDGKGKNPSYLHPPASAKSLSATHPSAHNAIFPPTAETAAAVAQAQPEPAAQNLKVPEYKTLRLKRSGKDLANASTCVQDPAFLVPVPLFVDPGRTANCAAVSGSLMSGERGGCTVGAPACRSNFVNTLPTLPFNMNAHQARTNRTKVAGTWQTRMSGSGTDGFAGLGAATAVNAIANCGAAGNVTCGGVASNWDGWGGAAPAVGSTGGAGGGGVTWGGGGAVSSCGGGGGTSGGGGGGCGGGGGPSG